MAATAMATGVGEGGSNTPLRTLVSLGVLPTHQGVVGRDGALGTAANATVSSVNPHPNIPHPPSLSSSSLSFSPLTTHRLPHPSLLCPQHPFHARLPPLCPVLPPHPAPPSFPLVYIIYNYNSIYLYSNVRIRVKAIRQYPHRPELSRSQPSSHHLQQKFSLFTTWRVYDATESRHFPGFDCLTF